MISVIECLIVCRLVFWGALPSNSIHLSSIDFSVFIVFCDIPRFTFSPNTYPFNSIMESVCSLTMMFPILPFTYIHTSIWKDVCSLTILYSILEFPYILLSIRENSRSLTMSFPIFDYTYILLSIR